MQDYEFIESSSIKGCGDTQTGFLVNAFKQFDEKPFRYIEKKNIFLLTK